ncbi:MAG: IS3 family transposase [SAR324 cluster bacterium]|nr:IS3 family transposase [SAR324 cluster bacterium]
MKPEVFRVFIRRKKIYASPRVFAKLKKEGFNDGANRVARLMREMGLRPITQRKYKATTNSKDTHPVTKIDSTENLDLYVSTKCGLGI